MKALRYTISILLFLPIVILFFLHVIFQNIFILFNSMHPCVFWDFELPELPIVLTSKTHEFFIRLLFIVTECFVNIFTELKNAKYQM